MDRMKKEVIDIAERSNNAAAPHDDGHDFENRLLLRQVIHTQQQQQNLQHKFFDQQGMVLKMVDEMKSHQKKQTKKIKNNEKKINHIEKEQEKIKQDLLLLKQLKIGDQEEQGEKEEEEEDEADEGELEVSEVQPPVLEIGTNFQSLSAAVEAVTEWGKPRWGKIRFSSTPDYGYAYCMYSSKKLNPKDKKDRTNVTDCNAVVKFNRLRKDRFVIRDIFRLHNHDDFGNLLEIPEEWPQI